MRKFERSAGNFAPPDLPGYRWHWRFEIILVGSTFSLNRQHLGKFAAYLQAGDSPYQCFRLCRQPLSGQQSCCRKVCSQKMSWRIARNFARHVDYGSVITWKLTLLDRAFAHFQSGNFAELKEEFELFRKRTQLGCLILPCLWRSRKRIKANAWNNWPTNTPPTTKQASFAASKASPRRRQPQRHLPFANSSSSAMDSIAHVPQRTRHQHHW